MHLMFLGRKAFCCAKTVSAVLIECDSLADLNDKRSTITI